MQGCYTNSTEVLFAALTLYHMRIIERLWGTRKFLVRCDIDVLEICADTRLLSHSS